MRICLVLVMLSSFTLLSGQSEIFTPLPYDHVWLLGNNQYLDFNDEEVQVKDGIRPIDFSDANASICNPDGSLLFYTNAGRVVNANGEYLYNGFRINPSELSDNFANTGHRHPQGVLVLPTPENESDFFLFYSELIDYFTPNGVYNVEAIPLYFAEATFDDPNNPQGVLLDKDIVLIADTLDYGKLTACRHGNGRDWWVLVPCFNTNLYHRFLLNPDGIDDWGAIDIGEHKRGLGQVKFSPDGARYVNYSLHRFNENYLSIYDFDRCTGMLSSPLTFFDTTLYLTGGLAFSQNGRFLYESTEYGIFQYDLESTSLLDSRVSIGEYDGHYSGDNPDFFWSTFYMAQETPDERIFLCTSSSSLFMHVIQHPNKRGIFSQLEQYSLPLLYWNTPTLPNYPNFRLGPWDGSPCDTLGIDNPAPTAAFEYTIDTSALTIEFFDASHYAESWSWSFGDGSPITAEHHPVYTFAEPGSYEVCLEVTNVTGSDVYCEVLELGPNSTSGQSLSSGAVHVFPNPADDYLNLTFLRDGAVHVKVFDQQGKGVYSEFLSPNTPSHRIEAKGFVNGVYLVQCTWQNGSHRTWKVLVQHKTMR